MVTRLLLSLLFPLLLCAQQPALVAPAMPEVSANPLASEVLSIPRASPLNLMPPAPLAVIAATCPGTASSPHCSTPQPLADTRHSSYFWQSRRFWASFSLTLGSAALDFSSSQHAFQSGHYELDPVFGSSRPSFGKMMAIDAPAEFLVAYWNWRKPGRMSNATLAADVADHLGLSAWNWRLSRRIPVTRAAPSLCEPAPTSGSRFGGLSGLDWQALRWKSRTCRGPRFVRPLRANERDTL